MQPPPKGFVPSIAAIERAFLLQRGGKEKVERMRIDRKFVDEIKRTKKCPIDGETIIENSPRDFSCPKHGLIVKYNVPVGALESLIKKVMKDKTPVDKQLRLLREIDKALKPEVTPPVPVVTPVVVTPKPAPPKSFTITPIMMIGGGLVLLWLVTRKKV